MKTSLSVGVIGYPNVGKSSIINSLKRQRAVTVGATPGVTKTLQRVKLDKQISLIDSPGVLFSIGKDDEDLVLRNVLKAEQLTDPVGVAYKIVAKCPQEQLCQAFKIASYSNAEEFLQLVAVKRGKIKKGGIPDTTLAAKSVILDWNSGKIPFHATPPTVQDIQTSEIVSTWNKEFGVDEVNPQFDEEAQKFSMETETETS
jgi:nuclear GTP-binding protein